MAMLQSNMGPVSYVSSYSYEAVVNMQLSNRMLSVPRTLGAPRRARQMRKLAILVLDLLRAGSFGSAYLTGSRAPPSISELF